MPEHAPDRASPTTAVIVAAYHQTETLRLLFAALAAAPRTDFSVHIADDGSAPRMDETLCDEAARLPFPVTFHWQPDDGFRKAEILNETVLATDAELLVFLDGDCIPHRDLIEVYRSVYRAGEFFAGSVGFLEVETSRALTAEAVARGDHERALDRAQLRKIAKTHRKNMLHRFIPSVGRKKVRPRIRGGNFAVARDLFEQVDGFDEVYGGHGKEDSDLRNRMRNAGARGVSVWTTARAEHLSREVAPSGARTQAPVELYEAGRRLVRARRGLSSHRPTASDDRAPAAPPPAG